MSGFFTKKETESDSRPDGKTYSCASCGLYKDAECPKMKPFGNFKKGILNIGEAPGEVEDERGKQWQGKTGRLLKKTYRDLGIDLFEDCLNINAVNCRPMEKRDNRAPSNYEIDCCRKSILKLIKEKKPKIIILLGNAALYSIIGRRWKLKLGGITKWRGWIIPDQDYKTWICPTFHPSYVERSEKEVLTVWKQDLSRAFASRPVTNYFPDHVEPEIKILASSELCLLERRNLKADSVSIDYETTGIKPQGKGHRIVCAALSPDGVVSYAFMMPNTPKKRLPFTALLAAPEIKKMAHNMKFEEAWSVHRLRQRVLGWDWDSMLAAHLLDNRPGVCSLKFQTYVHFGIVDYASDVSPWLASVEKGGNSLNKIFEFVSTTEGKNQLLKYCALDTIYQYRLSMVQKGIIEHDDLPF